MPEEIFKGKFFTVQKDESTGWEYGLLTDSMAVLVYVKDLDSVVLISQNRPPVVTKENPTGTIIETVAGRFDKKISLAGLVVAELKEEIGANIMEKDVVFINEQTPLALSPGAITEKMYLCYVEINSNQLDKDRIFGLESEGEKIERLFIKVTDLTEFVCEDMKTFALLQWFLLRLANKHIKSYRSIIY